MIDSNWWNKLIGMDSYKVYEYECAKCGFWNEVVITDPKTEKKVCPCDRCGSTKITSRFQLTTRYVPKDSPSSCLMIGNEVTMDYDCHSCKHFGELCVGAHPNPRGWPPDEPSEDCFVPRGCLVVMKETEICKSTGKC